MLISKASFLLTLAAVFFAASVSVSAQTPSCQPCHSAIAASQPGTRMGQTWRASGGTKLTGAAALLKREGPAPSILYSLVRRAGGYVWRVGFGNGIPLSAPVESVLGGSRHGYSLLARVTSVGGVKLDRAPLVETRYLVTPGEKLAFSPGHPSDKPSSWETAIGRVLSPWFERRCLACHAAASSGVQCFHCHGSGSLHAESASSGKPGPISNPARLSNQARVDQCGQCHADGRDLADPMPEDLLIASQADALVRSECYIQSGQAFNCSTCHDPHKDSTDTDSRYAAVCLSCHGAGAGENVVSCPVNPTGDCIQCHMPSRARDSFRMVDHWIRVAPQGNATAARSGRPKRAFLRMILVSSRELAGQIQGELARGAAFADLARRYSKDPSAGAGGFMGPMWLDEMTAPLAKAVAALSYGETSPVVETGPGFFLFERLPGDFRWRADALFLEATELKRKGQIERAAAKNQQALEINPTFLRALLFLGVTAGEQGDAARAVSVLESAARLYPRDTGTQLNLGIAYGATGRTSDEIAAYGRALEGEPDLVSARLNLGAAYLLMGRTEEAAEAYRQAVQTNPLSAAAYYNLSVVYSQQGKNAEGQQAMTLAAHIDSRFLKQRRP